MNILVVLLSLLLQGVAPAATVQLGTTVRPETTTVGQHFIATVRVRVPAGTEVRFPSHPDSAAAVDSAANPTRKDTTSGGYSESTMTYVLAAWDTGSQSLGIDSLTTITNGVERIVAVPDFKVYVRSVLPLDTALRKPKPFRPVVAGTPFNWMPWLIAAVALALVALAVAAWKRWRRKRSVGLSALQIAQREFARIDAQRLVESGETERHALAMVETMRQYLVSTIPAVAASATTRELAAALRRGAGVPAQRLVAILDETDLVKFARARVNAERAIAIGTEARQIVSETAAAQAAAEAAAAADRAGGESNRARQGKAA